MSSPAPSAASVEDYLEELDARHADEDLQDRILWPRTPIDAEEMQRIIGLRVGVSDRHPEHPTSRPHRVAAATEALCRSGTIPSSASVIDIACGDALVLLEVKRRNPNARCHAVDLNIGAFPSHDDARRAGIGLHRALIQDLFAAPPPTVDLAVMLNTYRGWENADLREGELDLPTQADAWFDASARWVLMTMRDDQIPAWRGRGYQALDFGRGEDASRMILLTRERVSARLRMAAVVIRLRASLGRLRRP